MNEYEKIEELIRIARQEGPQSQEWKLRADVEQVVEIFKEAGYRKLPSEDEFYTRIVKGWSEARVNIAKVSSGKPRYIALMKPVARFLHQWLMEGR